MSGTLIAYQGFLAQSVIFRRARGFAATLSQVILPVSSFPDGFDFTPPATHEEFNAGFPDVILPDTAAIREGRPVVKPLAKRLAFAGTLAMVEYQGSQDWRVVVHPLYVVRVETVRSADGGAPSMVKLILADERLFWARGYLKRWRWNVKLPNGQFDKTTLDARGKPLSLTRIAWDVTGQFPSAGEEEVPPEWDHETPEKQFPAYSSMVAALGDLVTEHDLAAPCLRLGGNVALYRRGEGRVGYAADPRSPNSKLFPAGVLLDKDGTGQGYTAEAAYPDTYVLVTGAPTPTIATVALDHCEPVLVHNNTVRVLNEELLREVLGKEFLEGLPKRENGEPSAMEWLKKFILMPPNVQDSTRLPKAVVQLLREQAWRLWRIPGVEVEVGEGDERNTEPGPNAHLLPLLARAETRNGQREPIAVEIYRFTVASRAMLGDHPSIKLSNAMQELQDLKAQAIAIANQKGEEDPFGVNVEWNTGAIAGNRPYIRAALFVGFSRATARILSLTSIGELHALMETARLIGRLEALESNLARLYKNATIRQLEAEEELGGRGRLDIFTLAEEAVAFERKVNEEFGGVFDVGTAVEGAALSARMASGRRVFNQKAEQVLRTVQQKREERRRFEAINGDPSRLLKDQIASFVRNETVDPNAPAVDELGTDEIRRTRTIRSVDVGARVYSAELGIVQTSVLAGHVEEEGVPTPSATRFRPMPVRVIFGAKLKPKVPGPNYVPVPFALGLPAAFQIADNFVPEVLSDQEGYFARAYKRTAAGTAEPVPVDDPAVQPNATVIRRPTMGELIPMVGEGNRAELEAEAEKIAKERFLARPKVEGRTHVLARPWPVQCDGVVASVEIRSDGTGFETSILTGGDAVRHALGATRIRPRNPVPVAEGGGA